MRISLDNQFGPASPLILCWNTRWGISFKSLVLVRVFLISMKEDPPLLQNTTCIDVAFNLSTTGLISGFIFFRNLHSYFNLKCRENILSSKIKVQRNSHNLLIFSTNKKKKISGFESFCFFLAGHHKCHTKFQIFLGFAHNLYSWDLLKTL